MPRGRPRKNPLPETPSASSSTPQATTAQRLGSLIKSARDILRKDKGLSGDADRLPQLTWIMFLKFLDDLERVRADEARMAGKRYRPIIEAPYRWRDWATPVDGLTGDQLIAFVNQEEARRCDGSKGSGLFAYLRGLTGGQTRDSRDVVATVFRGVVNRQINGFLLRDILAKIDGIHFSSSEEIHTLSLLYESMLKEMRDAAGDSGEFYTPRAVVRFCVAAVDPHLGDVVMDPACGTGGFLVEAYNHLSAQVKKPADRDLLQRSLKGCEAKPLPYLLAQMNLLLHGIEAPDIDPDNALRFRLSEIGEKDRVDVILTNPPFGGEEERGILTNFPDDKQTSETAMLFLQLIMRRLHRQSGITGKPGRAAVVVPNGTLFGDGVCARIKAQLLTEFNLHTIVRLPKGVFAPYTNIETNILFFDAGTPTKTIWYYELPLPEGRSNYSKIKPMQFEEFADCLTWWPKRSENDLAWKVTPAEVLKKGKDGAIESCNLDVKNPRGQVDVAHLPPEQLVEDLLAKERRIIELLGEVKAALGAKA